MEQRNSENTSIYEVYDEDVELFKIEKEDAQEYRERREPDWKDNYTLYRDKIITNRLTQRQTINVPLMKYALNTILKDVDEPPMLYFASLDNDDQAEVFYNEYWKEVARKNKLETRDIIDKKQAFLFGRPFKKLNIVDGEITIENVDPQDILIHRFTDPADADSAPCLIQTDIYRTLRSIVENEDYDEGAREMLQMYYSSEEGQLEAEETFEEVEDKRERLRTMGLDDVMDVHLGETYVELNEMYRYENLEGEDGEKGKNVLHLYVFAVTKGSVYKLFKKPLREVIGTTADDFWDEHNPFNTWAVDPEATDFWSDSVADIIRPINKVLNAWVSQLVENRTLRNFGMTFYDSTDKSFVPQVFTPIPFGFYPVPGDPNKIMKEVPIPDLSESLDEIQFLIGIAEKATAATAANSGTVEDQRVTLGEIELALANAKERVQSLQKFYTQGWKDFGLKYIKMLEAAKDRLNPVLIARKGRLGKKYYKREVSPENWKSKSGFTVEVKTPQDKQSEDIEKVQKLRILKAEMPTNVPLVNIYNKKLMEFAGLSADEISQVEEFENQNAMQMEPAGMLEQEGEPQEPAMEGAPAQGIPEVPDIAPVAGR